MSPDEAFVVTVLKALQAAGLEAIIVGNTAAAMLGAPVTTQDVDLLVRDTPQNRQKVGRFCQLLGVAQPVRVGPLATAETILGGAWPIDILYDTIAGDLSFASVRSRSESIPIADVSAIVASLEDVIQSKAASDRPKDRAVLPLLRDTLRVKKAIEDSEG
jgi:hypothetical protein